MPAAQCQLDHIVAFAHDNPEAGGWTIEANLQCGCGFHHELKPSDSGTPSPCPA